MQLTGTITTYNNTAIVANGVPPIVSRVEFSSNGSGDGSYENLYTPTNDDIFRIIAFQECLATSGGATIQHRFLLDAPYLAGRAWLVCRI
jgi:hypothetical protein